MKILKPPKKIVITGGGGRIGYQLLFMLSQGDFLGKDQPIELFILERTSNLERCYSLQMELEDCLFSILHSVRYTDNYDVAFSDADFVFLCGARICKNPQDRQDIQRENWESFSRQGEAINRVCSDKTLFMMVANPCNTNTLVLIKSAPNIPPMNFHSLVRLDQNRARQQLAQHAGVSHQEVKRVIVWGNHSPTIVPDCTYATIGSQPAASLLSSEWLDNQFISTVQERGVKITEANRGLSSCWSAAHAAIEAMKALITPTPKNVFYCSGIHSQGNPFGFDEDLVFSLPCRTIRPGIVEIVESYPPNPRLLPLIRNSEMELIEERERTQYLLATL